MSNASGTLNTAHSFLWSCLSPVVLGALLQQPTSNWHPCYLQNGINHILPPWDGFTVAYPFLFFVPPFLLSEVLDLQLDDLQNLPLYLLTLGLLSLRSQLSSELILSFIFSQFLCIAFCWSQLSSELILTFILFKMFVYWILICFMVYSMPLFAPVYCIAPIKKRSACM